MVAKQAVKQAVKKVVRKPPAKQAKTPKVAKPAPARKTEDAADLYVDQVRELVGLMVANDLTTIEIINGEFKISLGRGGIAGGAALVAVPAAHAVPDAQAAQPEQPAEAAAPAETLIEIKSPMVGTFYAAPSPDTPEFVSSGASVSDDSVVCIVEAMKVMNEIKAECSGNIAEIAVQNGQPVEFGQVLFRVRP